MNYVEKALKKFNGKRCWFYLKNQEVKERFKQDLVEFHAVWLDGHDFHLDQNVSYYMSVHQDQKIAFISSMVWKMSYATEKNIVYIDYEKLIHNMDYIMKRK